MIDLHMHTTASDGRCTPGELVQRAFDKGIRTMSVTDHDTIAAGPEASAAAHQLGMTFVPGIEVTSVSGGKDVHVLAYFLADLSPELRHLLAEQRRRRLARAQEIADRLASVGAPIDVDELIAAGEALGGKSLARPQIAQALIRAGHVQSVPEAFERFLGEDGPAYVPHTGASPAEVVQLIGQAGGLSSMAHPGYTRKDDVIPSMIAAGLVAIEAYHSSHDAETTARYLEVARQHGLILTGGSDYHGEGARRAEFFGVTQLPADDFRVLTERAAAVRSRFVAGLTTV